MDSIHFIAKLIRSIWFRKRPEVDDDLELNDAWFGKKVVRKDTSMANFRYKQGVSIPRILLGVGLAKSLPAAKEYTECELVIIDGEVVSDPSQELKLGDHEMYLDEHIEELMVEEDKWEDVVIKRKGPKHFFVIPKGKEDE